jgi:hypothetical protein
MIQPVRQRAFQRRSSPAPRWLSAPRRIVRGFTAFGIALRQMVARGFADPDATGFPADDAPAQQSAVSPASSSSSSSQIAPDARRLSLRPIEGDFNLAFPSLTTHFSRQNRC